MQKLVLHAHNRYLSTKIRVRVDITASSINIHPGTNKNKLLELDLCEKHDFVDLYDEVYIRYSGNKIRIFKAIDGIL